MKLYLITRRDLPEGLQAAQLVHAGREFQQHHPQVERHWYENSNTVALLEVEDEPSLERLRRFALERGVTVAAFWEPDRGNELTAIALGPDGKRLCRGLKPALRPKPDPVYSSDRGCLACCSGTRPLSVL